VRHKVAHNDFLGHLVQPVQPDQVLELVGVHGVGDEVQRRWVEGLLVLLTPSIVIFNIW